MCGPSAAATAFSRGLPAGYAEADRKPSAVIRRGNADARGGNMKPRIGWPTRDRAVLWHRRLRAVAEWRGW